MASDRVYGPSISTATYENGSEDISPEEAEDREAILNIAITEHRL